MHADPLKVLLVEDDLMIGDAIEQALRDATYAVDWVQAGDQAADQLARKVFGLVLLDLTLPRQDGLDILRGVRARGDSVPIIVITARDGLDHRIKGLDAGADDYLVKPFDVTELLARIRAVVRRRFGVSAAPVLGNGMIALDLASKTAVMGDERIRLSRREFTLLRELLSRPGAILSRSELEERIYRCGETVDSNAVDFIIHGLRKKLGAGTINNVRGLGWCVERGG